MLADPCCLPTDTTCDPYNYLRYLTEVSWFSQFVGLVVNVGTFLSFVPQIIKLYKKKRTEGISILWLTFALFNNWNVLQSIFMALFQKEMACLNDLGACLSNLSSLIQAFICAVSYIIVYAQFLYYERLEVSLGIMKAGDYKKHKIWYFAFLGYIVLLTPVAIVPGALMGLCSDVYMALVLVFQLVGAFFSALQWIPQITKTYKLKACGSFSIVALSIQTPGMAATLYMLITTGAVWHAWLATILSLLLHLILLIQLIYYYFFYNGGERSREKKKYKELENNDLHDTSLLDKKDDIKEIKMQQLKTEPEALE